MENPTGGLVEAQYSRRQYLAYSALAAGELPSAVQETVETTQLAHPEWDMDERMTFAQWNALAAET